MASDADDDLVIVSREMERAGVAALIKEGFATPQDELVSLIYMAMEYQRRKCEPAIRSARR